MHGYVHLSMFILFLFLQRGVFTLKFELEGADITMHEWWIIEHQILCLHFLLLVCISTMLLRFGSFVILDETLYIWSVHKGWNAFSKFSQCDYFIRTAPVPLNSPLPFSFSKLLIRSVVNPLILSDGKNVIWCCEVVSTWCVSLYSWHFLLELQMLSSSSSSSSQPSLSSLSPSSSSWLSLLASGASISNHGIFSSNSIVIII